GDSGAAERRNEGFSVSGRHAGRGRTLAASTGSGLAPGAGLRPARVSAPPGPSGTGQRTSVSRLRIVIGRSGCASRLGASTGAAQKTVVVERWLFCIHGNAGGTAQRRVGVGRNKGKLRAWPVHFDQGCVMQ